MKKVIFAASSGGHLTELLKVQELFKDYDYLLVTEMTDVTRDLKDKYNIKYVDYGPNKNKIKYWWTIIKNLAKAIGIVAKFRPDTVVSTGAQVGGFFCYIGKFFGAKVVYIETYANITRKSLTGKIIYPISDLFIVQWKEMKKLYPKAICIEDSI